MVIDFCLFGQLKLLGPEQINKFDKIIFFRQQDINEERILSYQVDTRNLFCQHKLFSHITLKRKDSISYPKRKMKLPVGIQQRSSLNHDRSTSTATCMCLRTDLQYRLIQQRKNPNLIATYTWSIYQWWSTNCKFTVAYMKPHQWRSHSTPCVADRPINETIHGLLS